MARDCSCVGAQNPILRETAAVRSLRGRRGIQASRRLQTFWKTVSQISEHPSSRFWNRLDSPNLPRRTMPVHHLGHV
ncbi:hypothetical protein TGAMA5MH_09887 [Trichoderma gamsii]|uniref:Uncharacterized protein n=1 Tax=Trichoderma gamsii TaxID=398673 RepID=A0A2K0SY42_9HYPO|nr:hypothetical protein TGAMA5MH_09887 [Trichoderma gamsii]